MVYNVPLWYILKILFNIKNVMIEKENKINYKTNTNKREITKTWLTGQKSCTLIIPRETALKYELDEPSHVLVEETPSGILIRKLDV